MTWLPDIEVGRSSNEADAVLGRLPDVYAHLRNCIAMAWSSNDADLMHMCRLLMAQTHRTRLVEAKRYERELSQLEDWRSSDAFSELERAAFDYVEQFMVDQNAISEEQSAELAGHLSERQVVAFVQAINLDDAYIRVLTLLDVPFDPADVPTADVRTQRVAREVTAAESGDGPVNYDGRLVELTSPELFEACARFARVTMLHDGVDDVTSEYVRLRNASHQKCRLCMSVRRVVVFPTDSGADDPMDAVRDYENSSMEERQKTVLRLADAFLTYPRGFAPNMQAMLLEHYEGTQIVEILLKLACWSQNRAGTALGMDEPVDATQLTPFDYDEAGDFALHAA